MEAQPGCSMTRSCEGKERLMCDLHGSVRSQLYGRKIGERSTRIKRGLRGRKSPTMSGSGQLSKIHESRRTDNSKARVQRTFAGWTANRLQRVLFQFTKLTSGLPDDILQHHSSANSLLTMASQVAEKSLSTVRISPILRRKASSCTAGRVFDSRRGHIFNDKGPELPGLRRLYSDSNIRSTRPDGRVRRYRAVLENMGECTGSRLMLNDSSHATQTRFAGSCFRSA